MFPLHPFYCPKYLPDLIRFGLSLIILNIYARVTRPRRFIDPMAPACLSGLPEVMVTDLTEIGKADPAGVIPNLRYNPGHGVRMDIVSLLILQVNRAALGCQGKMKMSGFHAATSISFFC